MHLKIGQFLGSPLSVRTSSGVTLTDYAYAAGTELPRHAHQRAYFSFPLTGRYEEHVGWKSAVCPAGHAVFHPSGEEHEDRFSDATRIFSIEIDDVWIDGIRGSAFDTRCRNELADPRIHRRLRVLLRLLPSDDRDIDAAVADLLGVLSRPKNERHAPSWMKMVLEVLLTDDVRPSLAELATIAGVHPVHLARTFRTIQGCSIGEFIRERRIDHAMRQIEATSLPLADIAAACGFADQSHLTREFRRATGVTPAGWRR